MYNIKYISNSGNSIVFGLKTDCVIATMDGITGYGVNISTSQGFAQTGVSISNLAVGGQSINIRGYVLNNQTAAKKELLSVFAPLSSGVLWWEDKYWLPVAVKSAPEIAQKDWARFSISLFAPYPFWRGKDAIHRIVGRVIPAFSFPVNYSAPHRFGTTDINSAVNCFVNGNLDTDFRITFTAKGDNVVNPSLVNLKNGKSTSFSITLGPGNSISMFREDGMLHVVKTADSLESNAFDALDDTSELFSLLPGDNPLRIDAESGKTEMSADIIYYDVYAGVYNGM